MWTGDHAHNDVSIDIPHTVLLALAKIVTLMPSILEKITTSRWLRTVPPNSRCLADIPASLVGPKSFAHGSLHPDQWK